MQDWRDMLAYELNHWSIVLQGFDPVALLDHGHAAYIFENRDGRFFFVDDTFGMANDAQSKTFITRSEAEYELAKWKRRQQI